MKKNTIVIFVALFFKLNICSKEINSLDDFLPRSYQDYRNLLKIKNNKEHNNNIKERYHVIKGDLNIFPAQKFVQVMKDYKLGYSKSKNCQFPNYNNDYYKKKYPFNETDYYENSYQIKRNNNLDDNVKITIQQIKLINDRYFQIVEGNMSNYNSNKNSEICPPSSHDQLKSIQN